MLINDSNKVGKFIEYTNKCAFFVNYPKSKVSREIITPNEIDAILEQRISPTRKFGQSGMKMNSNHTLSLKDKNSDRRILCKEVGSRPVFMDNTTKQVPVYEPIYISYK